MSPTSPLARRAVVAWIVFFLSSAGILAAILWLTPSMSPVRRGTSPDFWKSACRVVLDGAHPNYWGTASPSREGWYYYEVGHVHGSWLFCVSHQEVAADFDQVLERLRMAREGELPEYVLEGFRRWIAQPDGPEKDINQLVDSIRQAKREELQLFDPDLYGYYRVLDYVYEVRVHRLKWFWATVGFEWLYLSAVVYVALRPWIRGLGVWGWALHLGILPLLFMLPAYLGYATYSFTSAGPSGGVLYPWMLMPLRGWCTGLDLWLLAHTPQILEPLSPTIGSPMALSGRGAPGPISALLAGLLVAGCVLGLNWLRAARWWTRDRGWTDQVTIEEPEPTNNAAPPES